MKEAFQISVAALLGICNDKHNQALARIAELERQVENLKRELQRAERQASKP